MVQLGQVTETQQRSILDLEEIVAGLPVDEAARIARLFAIEAATGRLVPPEHMHRWVERYFGSVEAVAAQKVVKVTNRTTLDETLFNELRARRPLEARIPAALAEEIARTAPDPFCEPELNTPADPFGRVHGARAVTASNIAKYDGSHGVIIFREHDPLAFNELSVVDALRVAEEWFALAHAENPAAVYPLFMWNCLWKSGASIPHGHAQVSLTRGMHYGKVERQRRDAKRYQAAYRAPYFEDLYQAHAALGLAAEMDGVRVLAHLTPKKEKEVLLLAERVDEALSRAIYRTLHTLVDQLNVVSFNLVLAEPPLVPTGEDWDDIPVVVHVVDRGDPLNRTSDIGAMELYAASVVSSDPFRVAEAVLPVLA